MQLFANNAASVLASGITDVATSLAVAAGAGAKFPSPTGVQYFLVTLYQLSGNTEINHEVVKVTARVTDTLTIVRAQEGTTARAFDAADPLSLRFTAGTAGRYLATPESLTHLYHPTLDGGFRDKYRAGWLPGCFNQQHGGAQWGGLPDGSFGSVATGVITDSDTGQYFGHNVAVYFISQSFKVSENLTNPTIWLKLTKTGNPVNLSTAAVYADSSGSPNLSSLIGGMTAPPAKSITSKLDGEWYPFPLVGTFTANTQYHIVLGTGTSDVSNYYTWKRETYKKYPHGNAGYATSTPTWTQQAAQANCFLIQNPAANSLLQSGGMFDYKLAFNPGNPWNQSRSVAQPLSNFYDGKNFTALHRGTYAISTNVWDFGYGLDHDRITLTVNASGYPVLSTYRSDRTLAQVTGTGSVASGNHDVGVRVRTVGDGADYATLYVDGVSVGTPLTAQTFTMDKNFRELGAARLGDGFGIIPAWTQDMQMGALPSAQGWTWGGTGTEANCMSIQGGELYQNANGYTSTQTGYYTKSTTLNNATGWAVAVKFRIPSGISSGTSSASFVVRDGTKGAWLYINEYFVKVVSTDTDAIIQMDLSQQEHCFVFQGKGSDYYLFIDGRLVFDGTGKLTWALAANSIDFGDQTGSAGENANVIWSYVKYYQGAMILPIAGANTCSEFAHWSGDKSALFASLWNSGSPVSVKQLCGVEKNYIGEGIVQKEARKGVENAPSTTSTTDVVVPDLEGYLLGSTFDIDVQSTDSLTNAGYYRALSIYVNGVSREEHLAHAPGASYSTPIHIYDQYETSFVGMNKVEGRWKMGAGGGTLTSNAKRRSLIIEARS